MAGPDDIGHADEPRNRMAPLAPDPPPVLVHPPGPTATCRTCGSTVKVMESSGLAFWHRAPGGTLGCEDLTAYRCQVQAWKAERARVENGR